MFVKHDYTYETHTQFCAEDAIKSGFMVTFDHFWKKISM